MSSSECFKQSSTTLELSEGLQVEEIVRPLLRTLPAVLVRCNDGLHYIIHQPRSCLSDAALAVSLLGPAIAKSMGLTIAPSSPAAVGDHLAERQRKSPSLLGNSMLVQAGLYSACRLAGGISGYDWAVPYVSPRRWTFIVNHTELLGMQLLQTWAGSRRVPKAMFRRMEDRRSITVVFVGVNQLFADCAPAPSPRSLVAFATNGSLSTNTPMKEAVRAWSAKLQEAAQLAFAITFPALAAKWPTLDLSDLHAVLLNRLAQIDAEINSLSYTN